MKLLDVAFKDMTRSFRSAFALAFMFGVPIITAFIFFLAFGNVGSGEITLARTKVQLVNLDSPSVAFNPATVEMPEGFEGADTAAGVESMGELIANVLRSEGLAEIIEITETGDAVQARASVDGQEAGVAVIIPAGFTDAVLSSQTSAEIEFYQDPTLTIGPSIVKSVVGQLVDGFTGAKISIAVALEQLEAAGVQITPEQMQTVVTHYVQWSTEQSQRGTGLEVRAPQVPDAEGEAPDWVAAMIGTVLVGMMVFYAFYTGTTSAQTIITEDENGTLPRLFTTPTPVAAILGGKYLASGLTIVVQLVVLVIAGQLIFGIVWGNWLLVVVSTLLTAAAAATFGIFVMSFMEDARQAGFIYGGVVVVTGMLGMVSVFTAGMPNPPTGINTAALFVPQGWAVRSWTLAMNGGTVSEGLLTVGVLLAWSALFFLVGRARFNKRFA
ncbi:MAG: ABC transporter permease [Anaerolineae bacterium]|nr:ABC transporter permease [Anaerolineae bacterium]